MAMPMWFLTDLPARLVIINREPTPHDGYADVVLNGPAGEIMERVLAKVKKKIGT